MEQLREIRLAASQAPPELPRMRTAKKAAEELRKLDPETRLTESVLRRLMKEVRIPYVKVGARMLVNLDWLIKQLSAGESFAPPSPEEKSARMWNSGKIRVIPER